MQRVSEPKIVRVPGRNGPRRGIIRWRSAEERRAAKLKIKAIQRATEQERLTRGLAPCAEALRSPKVMLGMLAILLVVGLGLLGTLRRPAAVVKDASEHMQVRAQRSVTRLAEAMTLFRVHTHAWPSQRLGLYALARNYRIPGWKGPYINWAYKDPWGTPYVYQMPISPYEAPILFSCGPDKLPNTNDDIRAQASDFVCAEGTWQRDAAAAAEANEEAPAVTPEAPIN